MSFSIARNFVLRAGATVDCTTSLPWRYFQCWYSTKQKKVSDIIRWNTENKMLFGSKQTIPKKKAAESNMTKRTKKASQMDRGTKSKARETTGRKTAKKNEVKTVLVPEVADSADISETDEPSERWYEGETLPEESKSSLFHIQNEQYNKLLETEQAYEGVELPSSSWHSRSSDIVDIPKILPIPPAKNTPDVTRTAYNTQKSMAQKLTNTSNTVSTASFKEVDFIEQCPLFPSQFEEVRASAQEFHSFVESFKLRLFPTVNVVLNKTRTDLSNFFLQRWREKMIGELGEQGFKKHQEATIWQGTNLHACVQQYLSGVPLADIQVQESVQGHWDSISSVLPDVTEVQALETSVSHPWLCYRGTFDCIARYKKTLYVIDWKTSSKPKPLLDNLYDNPLQVAAYLGAINLTPDLTDQFGVIEQAAIVVAYSNGEAAHVHRLQPALCQHYWKVWCQRLHQYWSAVAAQKMA